MTRSTVTGQNRQHTRVKSTVTSTVDVEQQSLTDVVLSPELLATLPEAS